MAFTYTIDTRPHVIGDMYLVTGTFTNDGGSTGGDILLADRISKAVAAGANGNAAVVSTLTLVTAANLSGTWWAMGKR